MTNVKTQGNSVQVTISLDDLNEERFTLSYLDSRKYFQYTRYEQFQRISKRHKFRTVGLWSWYDRRNNTISTPPEPSQTMLELVKQSFMDSISFRLETER